MPEYLPVDENHPVHPINFYGFTKLEIERLLHWFSELKGIRFAALRYFNAAGYDLQGRIKGLEQNPANLLPIVMEVAKGGIKGSMQVFGDDYDTPDGSCIRDYIHVADLAEAHLLVANALEHNDTLLYNLGSGRGYSNQEIIDMAREVTGHDIPVNPADRRHGDATRLVASYEKIKRELGWEPVNSRLDNILRTAWEWHSKQSHLYDNA